MEIDSEFATTGVVTKVAIKPLSKHTIEIDVSEVGVLRWNVSYVAEPSTEDGCTVTVQKMRKFVPTDEPTVKNNFKIGEAGKVFLTIDNAASKKNLLY